MSRRMDIVYTDRRREMRRIPGMPSSRLTAMGAAQRYPGPAPGVFNAITSFTHYAHIKPGIS
jgi:hypothetical protein